MENSSKPGPLNCWWCLGQGFRPTTQAHVLLHSCCQTRMLGQAIFSFIFKQLEMTICDRVEALSKFFSTWAGKSTRTESSSSAQSTMSIGVHLTYVNAHRGEHVR